MRKPECTVVHEDFRIKRNAEITLECTVVHEDFRIKRNAEITLLGHLPKKSGLAKRPPFLLLYPAVVILQLQWMLS